MKHNVQNAKSGVVKTIRNPRRTKRKVRIVRSLGRNGNASLGPLVSIHAV